VNNGRGRTCARLHLYTRLRIAGRETEIMFGRLHHGRHAYVGVTGSKSLMFAKFSIGAEPSQYRSVI
jgi:hypothetical protein